MSPIFQAPQFRLIIVTFWYLDNLAPGHFWERQLMTETKVIYASILTKMTFTFVATAMEGKGIIEQKTLEQALDNKMRKV